MAAQELKSPNERHLEAARLVALGKQYAEMCQEFRVKGGRRLGSL